MGNNSSRSGLFKSLGLYILPIVLSLVISRWGTLISSASIVGLGLLDITIFVMAGIIYLRNVDLANALRKHPVLFVAATTLVGAAITGAATYFCLQPRNSVGSPAKNLSPVTPEEPRPPSVSALPIPSNGHPENRRKASSNGSSTASSSLTQFNLQGGSNNKQDNVGTVNCSSAINCAAINNGIQQINQYGAGKLALSNTQADAIAKAMKRFSGREVTFYLERPTDSTREFAARLCEALKRAGMHAHDALSETACSTGFTSGWLDGGAPPQGVSVQARLADAPFVVALGQTLLEQHVVDNKITFHPIDAQSGVREERVITDDPLVINIRPFE